MKKSILITGLLVFFSLAPGVFAQGFVPLAETPWIPRGMVADEAGLANFLNHLYIYLIGLAAVLAVIMIIWGGLEISTKDSVSKNKDGKERIVQAIIGLILVLSPALVFTIINPAILNLSISLPPLDTQFKRPPTNLLTTFPTVLPVTAVQTRQASGGTVLYAFALNRRQQNGTLMQIRVQLRNTLNAKQRECTRAPGGPGIILPDPQIQDRYVCQTCPPNTTLTLLSSCDLTKHFCGFCARR